MLVLMKKLLLSGLVTLSFVSIASANPLHKAGQAILDFLASLVS